MWHTQLTSMTAHAYTWRTRLGYHNFSKGLPHSFFLDMSGASMANLLTHPGTSTSTFWDQYFDVWQGPELWHLGPITSTSSTVFKKNTGTEYESTHPGCHSSGPVSQSSGPPVWVLVSGCQVTGPMDVQTSTENSVAATITLWQPQESSIGLTNFQITHFV